MPATAPTPTPAGFPPSVPFTCHASPASRWPGWFESSLDLRVGLEVTESEESEPAVSSWPGDAKATLRTSGPAARA